MKKTTLAFLLILTVNLILSANNIENIYGKNDLDFNKDYMIGFGVNFGSLLKPGEMNPRFIDIMYAENEIEILVENNSIYSEETEQYISEIAGLNTRQTEISETLVKIDLLLIDLKMTSADLYNLKKVQSDKEMRQKLQVSIEENRQQIYDIENKKVEISERLNTIINRVAISQRYIAVNNLNIRKNNGTIDYLKSCIDYSTVDSSSLDAAVQKSASYQNEVDSIINNSF